MVGTARKERAFDHPYAFSPWPKTWMAGTSPAMTTVRTGKAYPAPTAFFRHARCTAQAQPGGCEAKSFDDTSFDDKSFDDRSFDKMSLAGAAAGLTVGGAPFTARTSADRSCAGM